MDKNFLFVAVLLFVLSLVSPSYAFDAGDAIALIIGLVIGTYYP